MVFQMGAIAGAAIGVTLVMTIVYILIGAVLLWLTAAKIFKLRDQSFMTPLIIAAIVGAVGFVLGFIPIPGMSIISMIVGILLTIWLIKTKYDETWGKSVLVWLVYFVLSLIVGFLVGMLLAGIFVGGMMGGLS